MKRNTNNTLMLAYIVFIFVAVFTRHLYGLEKWNHIITAITVTSWIMVFSDVSESIADLLQYSVDETKDRLETYLYRVQHNKEINNHLDSVLVDDYGRSIGKTMKENLDGIERSVISFLNTIKKEPDDDGEEPRNVPRNVINNNDGGKLSFIHQAAIISIMGQIAII